MIHKYLENPIKEGVWFLNFQWINDGGISSDIEHEIENFVSKRRTNKVSRNNKQNRIPRIVNQIFSNEEELLNLRRNFSFIFDLFYYIYLNEIYIDYSNLQIIQALEDIDQIKNKYNDAYEIFKNEIYSDELYIIENKDRLFKIKNGIIVQNQIDDGTFSFCSLSYSPLEKLKDFLEKIGKIKDVDLRPEYSSEETVFTPYFSFLQMSYDHFIHDKKVKSYFKKAIREYKFENYDYCISTLGLIAEIYLIQVYETFYREAIPKKTTLGQTYDLINNKINNYFPSTDDQADDVKKLYSKLNSFLSEKSNLEGIKFNQEIIILMREILDFIKEDKKQTRLLINNANKNETQISLFPKYLQENINELIRHRNAISHNSRIQIGQYEAQRVVYCCITLIMWWRGEKEKIDWKDDKNIIIKETVKRNKLPSGK
jgi:hypothetical protein